MLTTAVENATKLALCVMEKDKNNFFQVQRRATELDMEYINNGCFSYVYKHAAAPGLVIKTCTSSDESCITYLAWARANPGPHIPRVHYLSRLKGGGYVAVLDQLYEMSSTNDAWFRECIYNVTPKNYEGRGTSLSTAAHHIYTFFKDIAGWDLHPGNALQDINGMIVITDPITRVHSGSGDLRTGIERAFGVAEAA